MTQLHETKADAKPAAPPPHVFTDANPEYPFLVYNHETLQAKAAKDKDEKEKLAKEGFVDEPFPPQDPESLTKAEVELLQSLLAKAARALAKLGELSEQHAAAKKEAPAKK